jgi:hypothetical protein
MPFDGAVLQPDRLPVLHDVADQEQFGMLLVEELLELLDKLFSHSVQDEFTWVHEWQVGDIVIWDNRCTMHRQMPYDPSERRLMKRTTIVTTKPGV